MPTKRGRELFARRWQGSLFRRRDFRLLWIGETTSSGSLGRQRQFEPASNTPQQA